jgi:hypothetical protein
MKAPIAQAAAEAASAPGCFFFPGASKSQDAFKKKRDLAGSVFSSGILSTLPRAKKLCFLWANVDKTA